MSRNSYDGGWLKGRGLVDKLSSGEVAEWLNAAVSKTVTSVIPASGVRIPPSPRFEHAPASPSLSARRLASPDALSARFGPRGPRFSARRLWLRQAASQLGSAQREAEMLRSGARRAERADKSPVPGDLLKRREAPC